MGNSRMTVYSRQSEGYINVRIDSKYNEITYQAQLDYSSGLLDPESIIKKFNNTAAEMLYITNIKSTEARGWGIMRFERKPPTGTHGRTVRPAESGSVPERRETSCAHKP